MSISKISKIMIVEVTLFSGVASHTRLFLVMLPSCKGKRGAVKDRVVG